MTDTFWDKLAPKYAAKPIEDPNAYEAKLANISGYLKPHQKVLEVGCGTGSTAIRLAPLVDKYLATDISEGMIRIAKNKLTDEAPQNLEFSVVDTGDMVQEQALDVLLAFSFLHLVKDLPGTLTRLHAQLKPGGLFISKTVCLKHCNPAIRLMVKVLTALGLAPYVLPLGQADLIEQISAAGFTIKHTAYFDKTSRNFYVVASKGGD